MIYKKTDNDKYKTLIMVFNTYVQLENLKNYILPARNDQVWQSAKMEMQNDIACAMTQGSDNWPIRKLLRKNKGSSPFYNACARDKRRESGMSATQVRHEWR